jgi:two-component system, NarL family, sensor histidine kinase UhpB
MHDPISLDCQRPLLVALPVALLHERGNTIDLRLAGYALQQVASRQRAGGIAAPMIGAYAQLHARHARDTLLAVTLPTVGSALLLLTGALVFVMARLRLRDSHLHYFSALAACRPSWHSPQCSSCCTTLAGGRGPLKWRFTRSASLCR